MSQTPLMPKATAVWLVENTSLTFEQIAEFCKLHPLEVKGIADGEVAAGIKGLDPITSGQLTREELERAAKNPSHHLKLAERKVKVPEIAVDTEVDLGTASGAYFIQARLNVSLPGVAPDIAQQIVEGAHGQCPYSKATHGNINVTTSINTAAAATVA